MKYYLTLFVSHMKNMNCENKLMESMPCKITQITTCVIGGSIKLANMLCILS